MKYYELAYLISPELSEKEAKDFSQEITNSIQKNGGVLGKTAEPLKIKLSYPIKKKERAYLFSLNFFLAPEKIKEFKEILASENNVLRLLIFSKKPTKPPIVKKMPKILPSRPKERKVELKEIEKKLEEILGSVP